LKNEERDYDMKKAWILLLMLVVLLSGRAAVEEVSNSINYAKQAADYITLVSDFANEAPTLVEQAVTDENARKELENKLQALQQSIESFNKLTPPEIAQDIHQQIVSHNEQLNAAIEMYMTTLKDAKFDPATFENSELMKTVQELSKLAQQIEGLQQ
jgi:actin-like ATPase involved in cell morphogenesis